MRQSRGWAGQIKPLRVVDAAGSADELRLLAEIQDEVGDSSDDLQCLVERVTELIRRLVGAAAATIEIAVAQGETLRASTGLAHAPFPDGGCPSLSLPVGAPRGRTGVITVVWAHPSGLRPRQAQLVRIAGGILAARLEHLERLRESEALVTENTMALGTLRDSERRFRNAFDHSGIGMALVARDGRWLKVNAALGRTLGYSIAELLAQSTQSVTHPDDVHLENGSMARLLAGAIQSDEIEKRYIHASGRVVWGLATLSAVTDARGQVLYFISQVQDITARKEAEEILRRHALRDSLTGLFNRGELDRLLGEEISRARRHGRALSLVMVDVDRFKRVNDTFGHPAGDRVLQQVANVLAGCLRTHDRVARYGGEEFAVILPETTGTDALAVAERMRARVASEVVIHARSEDANVDWPITISVGIASLRLEDDEPDALARDLMRAADAGLYAAKRGGRNRCVVTSAAVAAIG